MRILFVYPNENLQPALQVGIASLSAALKSEGHVTALFDTTFLSPKKIESSFRKTLETFSPDIVGISCRSLEWGTVQRLLRLVPDDIFIVAGGPHPTVAPEQVLNDSKINAVVIGEGEEALKNLANALQSGGDITGIPNLWMRRGRDIIKNELMPLISDLDTLPFPDWEIFDPQHLANVIPTKSGTRVKKRGSFETSRGCPFHCGYCINAHMQEIYRGKGVYHRDKSIDRTIREIAENQKRYHFEWVYFIDETLIADPARARDFFSEYAGRVRLPFSLMVHPRMADRESLRSAAKAGAQIALIGVESGDDEFRDKVLHRKVSDEQVIQAFENARAAGLATYSFNIVGFPGETREMIQKTIDLNRKAKADVVQVTIFYPFPGTALFDLCVEKKYLPAQSLKVANYYSDSVLELPTLTKNQIRRVAKLFPFYVKWPAKRHGILQKAEENSAWFTFIRLISLIKLLRAGLFFALANMNNPGYLFRRVKHFVFKS